MPVMEIDRYNSLVASINANGQRVPILLWGEDIIDGRYRYKACLELGIEPCFDEVDQMMNPDPIEFVLDLNRERRDLTASQREFVAARAANLRNGSNQRKTVLRDQAAFRKAGSKNPAICRKNNEGAPIGASSPALTAKDAAESMGVSKRQVTKAKAVLSKGCEELSQMVESGKLSTSAAEAFVKAVPDKKKQVTIVAKGSDAVRDASTANVKGDEDPKKYARATMVGLDKALREAATHNTKHRPPNYAAFQRGLDVIREIARGWS